MPASLSSRVVERLVQAEACEPNVHFRDDLRIARLTVAYAARGEAVLCSPHVLASYMTLGLHPEKVWPAILARQEALGLREEVSGAAGFAQTKPPKKPPQSVKLWFEKTNAARATNSRGAMQSVLHEPTISVPMAAPSIAALSTNSGDSGSAKERPFFKREELQEFFETCSSDLVRHPELRTMHGMWIAAGKPFGSEIQFFKAIKHYCEGAPHGGYKSESAVRANIRRAEAKGFLEIAYRDPDRGTHHIWIRRRTDEDRGLYRRVTTHRLSIPLLLKWRAQHHKVREMPPRKPDPPPTSPKPPAHAAPQPQRKTAETHRSPERAEKSAQPKLTRRECAKFAANVEQRKRGRSSYLSRGDGLEISLRPGDDGYAEPMNAKDAFLAECAAWAREPDAVRDSLKYWGYKIEPE